MYYRCKNCEYQEARGCLPTVTCGMYLFGLMGIVTGIAAFTIHLLQGDGPREPTDLGWWRIVLIPVGMVVGLLLVIAGAIALNYVFEFIEYVAYAFKKCPNCGARKWSWGYTRGFGL